MAEDMKPAAKSGGTKKTCDALCHLLSDSHVFFQRMRAFHWNIEGRDFPVLHKLFGDLYEMAYGHIDELAERVRILGQFPKVKLADYLKDTCLTEDDGKKADVAMAKQAIQDMLHLCDEMLKLHGELPDNDPGTKVLLETHITAYEKQVWFLRSYSK